MLLSMPAFADSAATTAASAASQQSEGLAEITVTAQRYESTILDTPISISAMTGAQLQEAGITSVEDIARTVPGISVRSAGPGLTEYDMRGLASNGGAAPTVGFYLDEIPLSPPAVSQSGKVVIDPGLYDVERVEILRGPQGTIYGSGSMGGTVKLVTAPPKLNVFEGSAEVTGSYTDGGGGNGSANMMLNLPMGDMLALRIVGGDTYRSGWINLIDVNVPNAAAALQLPNQTPVYNAPVASEVHHANTERLWNSRATLLFKPNDDLSVTLFAMDQKLTMGDYDLLDSSPTGSYPGKVYDAHYEVFPQREGLTDDIQIFAGTIKDNLGFAELTSATSYFIRDNFQGEDASESMYYSNTSFAVPLVPVVYYENDPSHQFSQEIRLVSNDTGKFHWVAGAFWSSLKSVWNEISANPALESVAVYNDPDGSYFTSWNAYWVSQFALFTDDTYKFNDQWRIDAGLRWYEYHSQQDEFSWGIDAPYQNQGLVVEQITRTGHNGYNPRVTLSYEPTDNWDLYTTFSRGFRPGGANQILPTGPPIFCTPGALNFAPDSAYNFELGEKARLLDNRLTVNADLYYIKWIGIQEVFTLPCGYQFYNNAGDGYSYGPELEVAAKLTDKLTFTVAGSYTEAWLTQPNAGYLTLLDSQAGNPSGSGFPCSTTGSCRVPIQNVAKDNISASLAYTTPVAPGYDLTARLDDQEVGPSTDLAYYFGYTLPSYNIANFHMILKHDNWSVNLFCDNIANTVALISSNNTSFQFNIPQLVRYSTNQPLTFGTQINLKF
jgi:outer membrane receptor protein involved in Fe transport